MSDTKETRTPRNLLGLPEEMSSPQARAWVLPIPYEATTSYGKGTCRGPAAIIEASRQVELYDPSRECEPAMEFGVHTMEPLEPEDHAPEEMVEAIADTVAGILSGTPRPELLAILGGEHTVSAGAARGIARALPEDDLVAVQIDAHADLRDSYEGSPFSHACAARRILDVCPVFQIGIRNISAEGDSFRKQSDRVRTVFAEGIEDVLLMQKLAAFVRGRTVFLTIDLDGLDPSIMPAVGTPEPGGLSWETVCGIARTVCREAASLPVMHAPDFLAAKLVHEILSYALGGI
jgi:agmatinase